MKKELTIAKNLPEIIPEQQGPAEVLIAQAIQKGLPVETMERLLAMRRELKAEWAKEQFDKAMAAFQGECPIIRKTKKVMNKDGRSVRYIYAPIDSIVEQVKDILGKNGLSYTIQVRNDGKAMTVVCRVTHKTGHSENSEFEVPISSEDYMSDVQKFGARSTFAKRYAFCNAFGIMTGDDDDDAQSTIGEKILPKALPAKNLIANIKMKIKNQIDTLTAPQQLKTAEEYQAMVLSLTATTTDPGLELIEKNYQEINGRLGVLIGERKEKK